MYDYDDFQHGRWFHWLWKLCESISTGAQEDKLSQHDPIQSTFCQSKEQRVSFEVLMQCFAIISTAERCSCLSRLEIQRSTHPIPVQSNPLINRFKTTLWWSEIAQGLLLDESGLNWIEGALFLDTKRWTAARQSTLNWQVLRGWMKSEQS